jgi:tetratricopeptide (TPR) repeat protein
MALAQSPASKESAQSIYEAARSCFESARTNVTAAWEAGRAAFDLGELTHDNHERSAVAQAGIDLCRRAVALDPKSAGGHYYLALNLGELASAKRFGAIKLLHEMERELQTAATLDPKLDYAGPDRSLGLLYLEAPLFPIGIGSRDKARTHLERAVSLNPDYPENLLSLAEAYAKWAETRNLDHELRTIQEVLPVARTRFPPQTWRATWNDWDARVAKLSKAQEKLRAPRPAPSLGRGAGRG